jgi:dTDP-4-dehydrorhamnose 3,5-epimerase
MELSASNWRQLFIPAGFAHGYLTLEPDTEVLYKCSDFYARECEGGLAWNDPDLAIDWGLRGGVPLLSGKDRLLPRLCDMASPFKYPTVGGAR